MSTRWLYSDRNRAVRHRRTPAGIRCPALHAEPQAWDHPDFVGVDGKDYTEAVGTASNWIAESRGQIAEVKSFEPRALSQELTTPRTCAVQSSQPGEGLPLQSDL